MPISPAELARAPLDDAALLYAMANKLEFSFYKERIDSDSSGGGEATASGYVYVLKAMNERQCYYAVLNSEKQFVPYEEGAVAPFTEEVEEGLVLESLEAETKQPFTAYKLARNVEGISLKAVLEKTLSEQTIDYQNEVLAAKRHDLAAALLSLQAAERDLREVEERTFHLLPPGGGK